MTTMILRRDAQPIRKRDWLDTLKQITTSTSLFWERIKQSELFQSPSQEWLNKRNDIIRSYPWAEILGIHIGKMLAMIECRGKKPLPKLGFLIKREKIAIASWLPVALVIVALISSVFPPKESLGMAINHTATFNQPSNESTARGPANWLDGEAQLNGFAKDAITGPFNYATEAGYRFAQTDADIEEMVADGTLVRLEGPYLELRDVSQPYVLPIVNRFANRLAQQYAEQGCGKLTYTSAIRSIEFQEELGNGHPQSVHPTGMALDAERFSDGSREDVYCLRWLNDTLHDIEGAFRLEATAERSPSHFHLVVVPNVYEAWLANRADEHDPEVLWLAKALFFEGKFNEEPLGYRAIGWAIKNRVRSAEFPNTIVEVVAEGAAGRNNGSCQFSFMCDGKPEDKYELCRLASGELLPAGRRRCDERWEEVLQIAADLMTDVNDPTGGSVLYYAASMPRPPYWARTDMRRGTVREIGSHIFACSVHQGDDACRT